MAFRHRKALRRRERYRLRCGLPCDVIHPTKDEPKFAEVDQLHIDPENCIHCGLCVAECPVNAIFDEADVPLEWADFIEKNAAYYRKQ
jgi:ferredoxin--NADP+ reductase